MKYFLLYILTTGIYIQNIVADNPPVRLTCIVDSSYTQTSQWVYWFTLIDNEFEIADSCFIQKGQKTFHLQSTLKDDYPMNWLTFSEAGPKQLNLVLIPGEDVTIYVGTDLSSFPKTEGSIGTKEEYELGLKIKHIHKNKERLELLLATTPESSLQKQIIDSLSYYQRQLFPNAYIDFLRTTQSGANYASKLYFIGAKGMVPREQIDSLEKVMLQRFPNSKSVQKYFDNSPSLPATEHSDQIFSKYNSLIRIHIPETPSKTDVFGTTGKGEYAIGTKVADIILDAIDGKKQRLSEIKSKYILIDFWASWCGPCCRGYSDLLKIQEKYPKELSIYAISIDSDHKSWQDAVERLDPKHLLTHVRAISGSEESKILGKQYGISAIPANFLLDESRKIIAINILGVELENKISQIIETQN